MRLAITIQSRNVRDSNQRIGAKLADVTKLKQFWAALRDSRASWMSASGEFLIDAAVAVALTVGGVILLGVVVDDFVRDLGCDRVRPTHRPQRHRRHVGSPTV